MNCAPDIRRKMIAKIHVAKKQLALTDESYRDVLRRVTGAESSAALSDVQMERVIKEFARLGFDKSLRKGKKGSRRMSAAPQAKKIRALWLTLKNMGQLKDASEEALAAYVSRMSGIDDLHWITPDDANKVIKGLRGWIRRVGGHPDDF